MEFDSPEVAKEFPGLYKAECDKERMSDPAEYDDDSDKKKKKERKDSKKDKGYATLAGESSHDEEDNPNPGKKRLKGFKLSSGKKKDKEKDKEKGKKTSEVIERKSADKDVAFISSVRIPFSADRHRDVNSHRSSVPSAFLYASATPKSGISADKSDVGESSNEKSTVSAALNAFLNAPAPIFLPKKKDKDSKKEHKKSKESKEHKKESKENKKDKDKKEKKEHGSSSVAKVKLKLMRSKNSLEEGSDLPPSHQFPEDTESLAKEIRKYEQLLEQTHLQIKSSKKVSKKQEEGLWDVQRTLTQLKRKLRSINALSSASANIHHHSSSVKESATDSVVPCNLLSNTIPPPLSEQLQSTALTEESDKRVVNDNKTSLHSVIKSQEDSVDVPLPNCRTTLESPIHPSDAGCDPDQSLPNEHVNDPIIIGTTMARENSQTFRKASARRSLDFSTIVVDNKMTNEVNSPTTSPTTISRKESREGDLNITNLSKPESPMEREKMEVQVLVHESISRSSPETENDPDEALPSRNQENIVKVVDDANAMIGSMHEELEEAAAAVFGQRKLSQEVAKGYDFNFKRIDGIREHSYKNKKVSKSEPTFGAEQEANDSSDIELIRDDEDDILENFSDELIPEILDLPVFLTDEYIAFENEQLVLFNIQIENDISKEEEDIEALMQELEEIQINGYVDEPESIPEDYDTEKLILMWQAAKNENNTLTENVSKLRQMVALDLLEEFKLETRLKYLEENVLPISPLTITTPLQTDA